MSAHEDIRRDLIERRDVLHDRMRRIRHDREKRSGPLSADWEEQAVELENNDVLDALDEHGRRDLHLITAALNRMELGVYGVCSECGEAITHSRLRALPFATHCLACAEETHVP